MVASIMSAVIAPGRRMTGAAPVPSTIVDATGPERARVLRPGALPLQRLRDVVSALGVEIADEG